MSPNTDSLERMAERYKVPALGATEYFLQRIAYRKAEHGWADSDAERAALADAEIWCRVWDSIHGDPGPQLTLSPDAPRHNRPACAGRGV
jgi:hypothetical protein